MFNNSSMQTNKKRVVALDYQLVSFSEKNDKLNRVLGDLKKAGFSIVLVGFKLAEGNDDFLNDIESTGISEYVDSYEPEELSSLNSGSNDCENEAMSDVDTPVNQIKQQLISYKKEYGADLVYFYSADSLTSQNQEIKDVVSLVEHIADRSIDVLLISLQEVLSGYACLSPSVASQPISSRTQRLSAEKQKELEAKKQIVLQYSIYRKRISETIQGCKNLMINNHDIKTEVHSLLLQLESDVNTSLSIHSSLSNVNDASGDSSQKQTKLYQGITQRLTQFREEVVSNTFNVQTEKHYAYSWLAYSKTMARKIAKCQELPISNEAVKKELHELLAGLQETNQVCLDESSFLSDDNLERLEKSVTFQNQANSHAKVFAKLIKFCEKIDSLCCKMSEDDPTRVSLSEIVSEFKELKDNMREARLEAIGEKYSLHILSTKANQITIQEDRTIVIGIATAFKKIADDITATKVANNEESVGEMSKIVVS